MALDLSDRLRRAGAEVSGDGDYALLLSSQLFGNEYFCYQTEDGQDAAMLRLSKSVRRQYQKDGVEREVSYVFGWPGDLEYVGEEEEEEEDDAN